jgi:hypothetical protein
LIQPHAASAEAASQGNGFFAPGRSELKIEVWRGINMNAFVTAVLMGVALLAIAVWVEIRERRAAP